MKAVVAAFNQEKALVGAFSVITNLRMELFEALLASNAADYAVHTAAAPPHSRDREESLHTAPAAVRDLFFTMATVLKESPSLVWAKE